MKSRRKILVTRLALERWLFTQMNDICVYNNIKEAREVALYYLSKINNTLDKIIKKYPKSFITMEQLSYLKVEEFYSSDSTIFDR